MGWGEGNEESRAAEAEAEVAAAEGWVEDGPRHACRRGCGAWPKSGDAVDHLEVRFGGWVPSFSRGGEVVFLGSFRCERKACLARG